MAQFDVHRNANPKTRKAVPYLLELQSELLEPLATRVVAPLLHPSAMRIPASRLNPRFKVKGATVIMSTAELAGVPVTALGERVAGLKHKRVDIVAALDFLFTGI